MTKKNVAVAETVPANVKVAGEVDGPWMGQFREMGWEVHEVREFTGGLDAISKDALIGVPFMIVEIKEHLSDFGEFWFCHVVTLNNTEGYFSDGGVGIPPVLRQFVENTGQHGGLWCKNGLRRSDYEADPERGRPAGTTYYLA